MTILLMAQLPANPSPRWEWRGVSFLQQCLPPKATGRNTTEDSFLVMKAKPWLAWYAAIAWLEAALVPGWQRTEPNPFNEKSVLRTTRHLWLKHIRHGSARMAPFKLSIACERRWSRLAQQGLCNCFWWWARARVLLTDQGDEWTCYRRAQSQWTWQYPWLSQAEANGKKLVLGLSGAITVRTEVVTYALKLSGEDETLFQTQQETIQKTNVELTYHIFHWSVKVDTMSEDVINNEACVCILIDWYPGRCC